MFGGRSGGVVVYPGVGCGGVGGGGVRLWGCVIGFTYWCGVCHAGLAAFWLARVGLGVVVL